MTQLIKVKIESPGKYCSLNKCLQMLGESDDMAYSKQRYVRGSKKKYGSQRAKGTTIWQRYGSIKAIKKRVRQLFRERIKEIHPDTSNQSDHEQITILCQIRDHALKIINKRELYGVYNAHKWLSEQMENK